ncbi:ribonuclease H-like domain-containing protein, partial [Lentinula edodes]
VYTDGSCINGNTPSARAGLGIYYGPNHPLNLAARVPGPQRNNRAELYAILATIQCSQPMRPLNILTDSTYAIQSLTYNASKNAQCKWDCKNGDLLKVIAQWVASRPAPIHFTHVRAHSGNAHNDAADRLAKHGTSLPLPPPSSDLDFSTLAAPLLFLPPTPTNIPKVSTSLPDPRLMVPMHNSTR